MVPNLLSMIKTYGNDDDDDDDNNNNNINFLYISKRTEQFNGPYQNQQHHTNNNAY